MAKKPPKKPKAPAPHLRTVKNDVAPLTRACAPVDAARKRRFIQALRKTGVRVHAARIASPHTDSRYVMASFRDAMHRDSAFEAEVLAAEQEAIGRLEAAVYERAVEGWTRPLVSAGKVVTQERCFDNKAAMWLLSKKLPKEYGDRSSVEVAVSGQVDHTHHVGLTVSDINKMSGSDRAAVLKALRAVKAERDLAALPPLVEEADYVEISHQENQDEVER